MSADNKTAVLQADDSVIITGKHPWTGERGTLVAYERYGPGWMGWRVALENGAECYVDITNLRKAR